MPAEWMFKVAFLALFVCAVAIRVRYQRLAGTYDKGMAAHTESHLAHEARPLLIIRPLLGFPWYAVVLCWFFAPQWVRWSFVSMPGWLRMGGLLLAVLGLLLLWRSHAAMGRNFRPTLEISPQQELVTSGPYAFVRHPLYAAFLLMLASIRFHRAAGGELVYRRGGSVTDWVDYRSEDSSGGSAARRTFRRALP